jgi:hypothetical protein
VVIPEGMNRGLPAVRAEFLALADAIQGPDRSTNP